jgi:hypothetical protein
VLHYDSQFEDYYRRVDGQFVPINFHPANRYKWNVTYWEKIEGKVPENAVVKDGYMIAKVTSKWEFLFYDKPLYVYVPIREEYFEVKDTEPKKGKTYYVYIESDKRFEVF